MVYLQINERSAKAKSLLAFLKTEPYIKVIEKENIPKAKTNASLKKEKRGKLKTFQSVDDLMADLHN